MVWKEIVVFLLLFPLICVLSIVWTILIYFLMTLLGIPNFSVATLLGILAGIGTAGDIKIET